MTIIRVIGVILKILLKIIISTTKQKTYVLASTDRDTNHWRHTSGHKHVYLSQEPSILGTYLNKSEKKHSNNNKDKVADVIKEVKKWKVKERKERNSRVKKIEGPRRTTVTITVRSKEQDQQEDRESEDQEHLVKKLRQEYTMQLQGSSSAKGKSSKSKDWLSRIKLLSYSIINTYHIQG
ncbi:hypothetical protein BT96DRAFT_947555 [Gymnopus androsaceus JB14]|uniref:Uncharacterized protein n=1 Tax=Gymnopus androsaceus JB14 TaxID=1447944 RepID=A0A6A4GST7_9AGAR|nr:hypothetical protein BT96DRAFT_947555 [Gymnopus androsaceus JB14]